MTPQCYRKTQHLRLISLRRISGYISSIATVLLAGLLFSSSQQQLQAQVSDPCAPPVLNPIVCENSKPGNPQSEWDVSGAGSSNIQGFATDISVDQGQTVHFKIDTNSTDYRLDIYRLGYYNGLGARKIVTVEPSATLPQNQPNCLTDASTGLVDCGNWSESASWAVPSDATSGIYLAKLVREDGTIGTSHVVFVVRDDDGLSDILFQTSDTTWQAYNQYGGNSLYVGAPAGRAYKVSYNRPFTTRGCCSEDWVFNAEYPMVRWLEANGYNISYFTGIDSDRRGLEILEHDVFLSVGHDEYWSAQQRARVEAARNAGVHLAFFSGNEVYWKIRWENSLDGLATPYRTLVSYKETHANAKIDPLANVWTGTWRDPRFSPPADGGRPENELTGTLFMVNDGATSAIQIPEPYGKLRLWRNTSVATLALGEIATLPHGTLGYEWDEAPDNGFQAPGLLRMSSTTVAGAPVLIDFGSTFGSGTATHSLTLYRHSSGARVFSAGTVQWSWGLDSNHDRGSAPADVRMQQATVNLLADMSVQPGTLQAGLVAATASTDTTAPTSAITSPTAGATVQIGTQVTIVGAATDGGGVVGSVEVSVDGGTTWALATGRTSWSYTWVPGALGSVTVKSRAVDDSGNVETPSTGITVTVSSEAPPQTCPCTIWSNAALPVLPADPDTLAVELGVKFRVDVSGYVTGLRFYKGPGNTGTHVGNLWTSTGTLLASAIFTNETATGWQQVNLPAPVAITANTTYVASYHAPVGRYAGDVNYFTTSAFVNPPLRTLANGTDGPNGVYKYGASGFPTDTFSATNYYVDVVFNTVIPPDTTPPSVSGTTPTSGATGVTTNTTVTVTFNEPMTASTINTDTFELRDNSNAPVAASVIYNATTRTATLTPSSLLANGTTYTATVKGGGIDPRVKDVAGNALAANFTWSFTTAFPPPSLGPGGPILIITSTADPFSRYYTEILYTEGFNLFTTRDISQVTASFLISYDVVILGSMSLTPAQVTMLTDWVNAGGNLIAMRPDKQLANLLGLTDAAATLSNAYLRVTASGPGAGIVNETIQFRGTADRYTLNGATSVASLYQTATTATNDPAVSLHSVGTNGGQAAAFTYDLAQSTVYMHQGNPAWSGQERDPFPPIRSNDLYYGAASGDPQPDWVDLNKVAIPQADEQQRLLANLITHMNADKKPLPRFWYFPRGLPAVVIMTGDDHASGGTAGRFDQYLAASPPGCSVSDWECIRSTSYIYNSSPLTNAQASTYVNAGFEVALHVNTGCADWTPTSLASFFTDQLNTFAATYPSVPTPATNRTHCLVWSDYSTQPEVELSKGIRLDTNYYYWPPSWLADRPGFFTGSGMPMRFVSPSGALVDIYQATTQMTDESGQSYPFTIDSLLDKAIGPEGYYGAFTANIHTDFANSTLSDAIVNSAKARGVAVVSARQMLTWLDGRNNSAFGSLAWNTNVLSFSITAAAGANRLEAMVPMSSTAGALGGLTRNGNPTSYTTKTIKGVNYAFFTAQPGSYQATYAADTTPPAVTGVNPINGATGVATSTTITATFSEPMDPTSISTNTFELRDGSNTLVPATVTYNSGSGTAMLTPSSTLAYGLTYTATVKGGASSVRDVAGNALAADFTWSLTTTTLGCPCSLWNPTTTPGIPNSGDSSAVEVGAKFRSDVNGFITAIRFYKGSANIGTHIGNVWTSSGTLLASVTFTDETDSGWQQANLITPVAITAGTTYVVSYHAPVGQYALNGNYFAAEYVNAPLRAPASGAVNGNGVYLYGAGGFPTQTFNAANYWVDVVFDTELPLPDTTPPTVISANPTNGANGIATSTIVTAILSEPIAPATVNTATFELRDQANTPVPAIVTYSAATNTITLTPSGALAYATTYTATIKGGAVDPRVKDTAGNALATDFTWSFTTAAPPVVTFTDTSVTDFSAGTRDANSYVATTTDGELILAPTVGAEFAGSTLPAGWFTTLWATGGTGTVANDVLTVNGARSGTTALYGAGRSLEFVATFTGAANQNVGFSRTFGGSPWAMFSTNTGGSLFARSRSGTAITNTQIPGTWLGAPHLYRIDWNTNTIVFSIDGTVVVTHARAISTTMRPLASDATVGGDVVTVDWMRMTSYATSSVFLSRIFDASFNKSWGTASWISSTPSGTSLAISVRTGNTPTPDATWTLFSVLSNSGVTVGSTSRYIQYRAELATTVAAQTPILRSITIQ